MSDFRSRKNLAASRCTLTKLWLGFSSFTENFSRHRTREESSTESFLTDQRIRDNWLQ